MWRLASFGIAACMRVIVNIRVGDVEGLRRAVRGRPADNAFRVHFCRRREDCVTRGVPFGVEAMMDIGLHVQREAAVMVSGVVPATGINAMRAGVFERARARR